MPDFRSDEEMLAFYMMLSEDQGVDFLNWKLQTMTERQQQAYLDKLRRFRTETGRKNPS